MTLKEKLQHRYALSEKGAQDMIRAFISVTISDIVLMLPVGMLYMLVKYYMADDLNGRGGFFAIGCIACLILIAVTTYIQYNATFLNTYIESGVRRTTLAEKLRKIPLSFFGKKDLSDLTSAIMADCATMETASSHWIPELIGACISTVLVAVSLFFLNWRMAIAALWVLPVSFLIVLCSGRVQKNMAAKQMTLKMACADGIQECLETVRDLRANNSEDEYLKGLDDKIHAVEKHAIFSELTTAVFVAGAQMILKFGIATTALLGGMLLAKGDIDVLTFFMFLLLVSRLYDPMQISLQNLAAIIATDVQCERLDEILSHKVQKGKTELTNKGYDIEFSHVGFAYDSGETVLKDVSFTAKQGEVTALIGPSGGGKTTVSRLASRFWDAQKGRITIGGMDIQNVDPETLMSLYSIVFQDVTLFNNSIMENIRIGRQDATDEEVIAAAKAAHIHNFIMQQPGGYQMVLDEETSNISQGQKQLLTIARAILADNKILILDEATSSVDTRTEMQIQKAMDNLMKGRTSFVIAHRLSTIKDADLILVMKDGDIIEQGNHKELLAANGFYADLYNSQFDK